MWAGKRSFLFLISSYPHALFITVVASLFSMSESEVPGLTNVVYKACELQTNKSQSKNFTRNLNILLDSLTESSETVYFKKETSDALTSLFQCRNDLLNSECHACVSQAANISQELCEKSIASRIQLTGCYLDYRANESQPFGSSLLFYSCGSALGNKSSEFESQKDAALQKMMDGINQGVLFYNGQQEGSHFVLSQCEGDLSVRDCFFCLNASVVQLKSKCSDSDSGVLYFNKCFLLYGAYGEPYLHSDFDEKSKANTPRTVAIVVGAFAAALLVIVSLQCLRSTCSRKNRTK